MIRSMTGYGRAAGGAGERRIAVEVTSVNRKMLDVAVSVPREWQRLEPEITAAVRDRVERGRIHVVVSQESRVEGESGFFDSGSVGAALEELGKIALENGIPFEPDAAVLTDLAIWTQSRPVLATADSVSADLQAVLSEALDGMLAMREAEGSALARDLSERRLWLIEAVGKIREAAAGVVPNYREQLMKRLRQLGLELDPEDERVLREIALFADRADISEELTRLESHFSQFGEFLESAEPVGRKFEFLLQEIGREFNTVGSKANESSISRMVIDCKTEIERIREQVQNIE